MGSTARESLLVFLIFCIGCANCDIEDEIQKCTDVIRNEYNSNSPTINAIHGLYCLDLNKFTTENTVSGEVYEYYLYLLNTIDTNKLLNTMSPKDYCDTKGYLLGRIAQRLTGYSGDTSEFVELAHHVTDDVTMTRLKEMCTTALVDIGCTANEPGFKCFEQVYLNYDKIHTRQRAEERDRSHGAVSARFLDIHVDDLYSHWRQGIPNAYILDVFSSYYYPKVGFIQGYFMKYTVPEILNINRTNFMELKEFCRNRIERQQN